MKKALFLVGQGDTGKSQLKSLVERLLGGGNFIGIDLKEIESRFGTGAVYDHCSHEVCTFSLSFLSHPGSVHPSNTSRTFSVHILQYNKNGTHSAMFLPYSALLMEIP